MEKTPQDSQGLKGFLLCLSGAPLSRHAGLIRRAARIMADLSDQDLARIAAVLEELARLDR